MSKTKMITTYAIVLIAVVSIGLAIILSQPSTPNNNGGGIQGDGGNPFRIVITDLSEYNTFTKTYADLPDNFITWDMVNGLGSFDKFSVFSDEYDPVNTDIFQYKYIFDLKNGERIQLKINTTGLYRNDSPISRAELGDTMINTATAKDGKYVNGGLTYYYGKGDLAGIEWTIGNNTFYLDDFTAQYPYWTAYVNLPKDHIISKLLSTDPETQLAALNELTAAIENN